MDHERIRQLRLEGLTYKEIASLLGKDLAPEERQEQRRRAIALTRGMPGWKRRRILELRREGLSYQVIAERVGVHLQVAYKVCRRAALVQPCVCAACGRTLPGRRHPGVVAAAAAEVQPTLFLLVVCARCKPTWKQRPRLQARGGGRVAELEQVVASLRARIAELERTARSVR